LTAEVVTAGFARWPGVREWGVWGFFGVTDCVMLTPLLIYDIAVRRRIHPATIIGGIFLIASQPLRLMIGGTEAWLAFARWLTS